jgi:hypothetical protein
VSAPRPKGTLTAEALACIRNYNGSVSSAAQVLAALSHVKPLSATLATAYAEASAATQRLAKLAADMLEWRDAALVGDVAETQPEPSNDDDDVTAGTREERQARMEAFADECAALTIMNHDPDVAAKVPR